MNCFVYLFKFRMTAKCLEITGTETFRYFALNMPSMPAALLILRFWSSFKTRTVRGSDYSPAIVLSEEKDIL